MFLQTRNAPNSMALKPVQECRPSFIGPFCVDLEDAASPRCLEWQTSKDHGTDGDLESPFYVWFTQMGTRSSRKPEWEAVKYARYSPQSGFLLGSHEEKLQTEIPANWEWTLFPEDLTRLGSDGNFKMAAFYTTFWDYESQTRKDHW
jgi:hypothetical protein